MNETMYFLVQGIIQIEILLLLLSVIISIFLRKKEYRFLPHVINGVATGLGLIIAIYYLWKLQGVHVDIFSPANAPWLSLHIEMLSAIFFLIINAVAFPVSLFSIKYTRHLSSRISIPTLMTLTTIFILGMLGVLLSSTPLAFIFFWELMSVSSFLLVLSEQTKRSIRAGLFYFIMTQLGAISITLGFAIVSGGNLLSPFAKMVLTNEGVLIPFLLFFIGFGSKAGLLPLHVWLPLAHPEAPSNISALMSGAMLKIAVFGYLLVLTKILPPLPVLYGSAVIFIGLISALYGAVNAIVEKDIKVIFAWSSIENIGLIFTMIGTAMYAGARGNSLLVFASLGVAIFMSLNHALFKTGLFMSAGIIAHKLHTRNIDEMGGLAKQMPLFGLTVFILALTAGALPPAGAFFGEWIFLRAIFLSLSTSVLVDKILYAALFGFVGLIGGLGVFVMVRFFGIAFLGQSRSKLANTTLKNTENYGEVFPIFLSVLGTLVMGIGSPWIFTALLGGNNKSSGGLASLSSLLTSGFFLVTILVCLAVFFAFLFHKKFISTQTSRSVNTWDCGQPITPRMEYTGTGFAAPIRFFFLTILQSKKVITRTQILETNAYLRSANMYFVENPIFEKFFYIPVHITIASFSRHARKLHGGAIGTYFVVMLLTLVISLTLALWNN